MRTDLTTTDDVKLQHGEAGSSLHAPHLAWQATLLPDREATKSVYVSNYSIRTEQPDGPPRCTLGEELVFADRAYGSAIGLQAHSRYRRRLRYRLYQLAVGLCHIALQLSLKIMIF
ncbi:MAG: hypothetical protein INR73_00525 [Williamsia sp.]|nr:hypothetical protein [Williamsia sp.]